MFVASVHLNDWFHGQRFNLARADKFQLRKDEHFGWCDEQFAKTTYQAVRTIRQAVHTIRQAVRMIQQTVRTIR